MFGSKLLATVGKVKNLVGDLDDKLNPEDNKKILNKGETKGLFGESRREEEERLAKEAEEKAKAEAEKKKTNMMLIAGGAIVLFMLFGKKLMK